MQIVNINKSYFLKQNDTASDIQFRIDGYDGLPYALTGTRVEVVVGDKDGRVLVKEATLLEGIGELSFGLDDGDFIPHGKQRVEVHIYDVNNERTVAPSKGYYQLRVEQTIDDLGETVTSYTFDFFMEEIKRLSAIVENASTVALDTAARMDNTLVELYRATDDADRATAASTLQTSDAKAATLKALLEAAKVEATNDAINQGFNERVAEVAIALDGLEVDKALALNEMGQAVINATQVTAATEAERLAIKTQQTTYETLINGKIVNIEKDASDAKGSSQEALDTSKSAETKSDASVVTANEAKALSISADERSKSSDTKASAAVSDATVAKTNAASALTDANTALSKSEIAERDSFTALSKSTSAETNAEQAKTTAESVRDELDKVISDSGSGNPEVVIARGSEATLGTRLDKSDAFILRELHGITSIQLAHGLNDYPSVHAVVADAFGVNFFGFGVFGGGERYSTSARVEYLDKNSLLVHIPEDLQGTPTIKVEGNLHTVTFPDTDAVVELHLRGNN